MLVHLLEEMRERRLDLHIIMKQNVRCNIVNVKEHNTSNKVFLCISKVKY